MCSYMYKSYDFLSIAEVDEKRLLLLKCLQYCITIAKILGNVLQRMCTVTHAMGARPYLLAQGCGYSPVQMTGDQTPYQRQ